jgi:hypothetical protein
MLGVQRLMKRICSGFDTGDARAELIKQIPDAHVRTAIKKNRERLGEGSVSNTQEKGKRPLLPWPDYARPWLLQIFGAEMKEIEGRQVTVLDGRHFSAASFEEAYLNRKPDLIRSMMDFINKISRLPYGKWLYRGKSNSRWELKCGLDRAGMRSSS